MKNIILALAIVYTVQFFPLLAQENTAVDQNQTEVMISKIKANLEKGEVIDAQKHLDQLFKDLKPAGTLENTIVILKEAILCFRNHEAFYESDKIRNHIISLVALDPSEIRDVYAQMTLMISYLDARRLKTVQKEYIKYRKQNTSILLTLWKKFETSANIDEKEIELPKSFWGDDVPLIINGFTAFQDKDEEARYKKHMEGVAKIFQKRNDKRDAGKIMQELQGRFIPAVASMYSASASDMKEIEELLKKYDINQDISRSIVRTIKGGK